jgi:hypothetical protein
MVLLSLTPSSRHSFLPKVKRSTRLRFLPPFSHSSLLSCSSCCNR